MSLPEAAASSRSQSSSPVSTAAVSACMHVSQGCVTTAHAYSAHDFIQSEEPVVLMTEVD